MKIRLNEDAEVVKAIRKAVEENDGYCPCRMFKTEDSKCMCKEFKEQSTPGLCYCGLYEKVAE